MKISNASQAAELLGTEATTEDGEFLLELFERDGITDTAELTDDHFAALLAEVAAR